MVPILSLWLPILVSAVAVFVVSSVVHMVFTYHQNDYVKVPNEDQARAAIRPLNLPPGDYVVPKPASTKEMQDPAFVEKMNQGPVLFMTVFPNGPWAMGGQLAQWFVYCIVISVVAAYVAGRALGPGAEYLDVFRFTGTTAFAAYGLAHLQASIWFKRKWSTSLKSVFDALLYAVFTAGPFGWLWPS